MRTIPAVTRLTRTLGAHSTAAVWVKLTRPALAAPYAAVCGVGRSPLTLPMLTIDPPSPAAASSGWRVGEQKIAANRLRATIRSVNRGVAVVVSAGGDAAGVVHEHVEVPEPVDDLVDHRPRGVAVAEVDAEPRPPVGQVLGLVAGADRDRRPGVGEASRDPPPDTLGAAGDEHDPAVEVELDRHGRHRIAVLQVRGPTPTTRASASTEASHASVSRWSGAATTHCTPAASYASNSARMTAGATLAGSQSWV